MRDGTMKIFRVSRGSSGFTGSQRLKEEFGVFYFSTMLFCKATQNSINIFLQLQHFSCGKLNRKVFLILILNCNLDCKSILAPHQKILVFQLRIFRKPATIKYLNIWKILQGRILLSWSSISISISKQMQF